MFGFLKVNRQESRGFNYKPRYYDAEKESLKSKIRESKKRDGQDIPDENKEIVKMRVREEIRLARSHNRRDIRGLWQGGNMRMVLVLIALIGLFYFLLNKFLPIFMQMLFYEN
jgi:hypothetical protein